MVACPRGVARAGDVAAKQPQVILAWARAIHPPAPARPARERLRSARKSYRSARFRTRERLRPVRVEQRAIEEALRELGLGAGADVWMQTQMSSFGTDRRRPRNGDQGPARGGRAGGPGGDARLPRRRPLRSSTCERTLSSTTTGPRRGWGRSRSASESCLGATAACTRPTRSQRRVPAPQELLAGHERAETPFGEGTPFLRLIERNARQVFFGTSTRPMTMFHAFECTRRPPFPYDVFLPERFPVDLHRRRRAPDRDQHPRPPPPALDRADRRQPPAGRRGPSPAQRRRDGLRVRWAAPMCSRSPCRR